MRADRRAPGRRSVHISTFLEMGLQATRSPTPPPPVSGGMDSLFSTVPAIRTTSRINIPAIRQTFRLLKLPCQHQTQLRQRYPSAILPAGRRSPLHPLRSTARPTTPVL